MNYVRQDSLLQGRKNTSQRIFVGPFMLETIGLIFISSSKDFDDSLSASILLLVLLIVSAITLGIFK